MSSVGPPTFNFPAFNAAAARLRAMGHEVINPADFGPEGTWEECLARDLPCVCSVDALAVLPGWQRSRGARLEVYVARSLGKPILDAETLQPWGRSPQEWQGRVVGFWGVARAGKDTACLQLGWPRAAMADELKADLALLTGLMGFDPEDKGALRDLWVEYGRLGRKSDPNYWVNRLVLPPDQVGLSDVRYWSEIQWVLSKGGMIIAIIRPGYRCANREEEESFAKIRREAAQAKVVIPIAVNNGTPDQLGTQVRMLVDGHYSAAEAA